MHGASDFVYDVEAASHFPPSLPASLSFMAFRAVVLTWMEGWYKGDEDNAIIDTEVFIENAKKFGAYCGKNPTVSVVTAADEILGK